ncbi:RNA polymerase sigma factor [Steroidobacter sp.]|uniref:RNA polymerase sigma factor n=1 Tax=Steroidobacter sp. TaxID=1978227 RepID=UPI001A44BEFC|nr:RNA polymerase sigma factor [Steroidobacter sp.]MBL8271144.1 RNA polymerase sigma factor [Steroidobacter sp.]
MDEPSRYRWIAANILPHEAELRAWLRRRVRALQDSEIDDLVQEAFARIWASELAAIRNGRAYFFATVRHLLAEYARRRRIVPIELLGEIESLNLISEEPGLERQVGARQELARLKVIVAALPAQCRRVFELCKLDGLSYRQAAGKMGLSEKTVENHLGRALARIADSLARSEPDIAEAPRQPLADAERGND